MYQDPATGETLFPELSIEGRPPVALMAVGSLPLRTFGAAVLKAAGFEVRLETRGEAILADLDRSRPDLILSELLLDDMDVVHLCSRLRKLAAGKAVPILVLSELIHAATIRKILTDDRTDFIPTPVQWQVLVFRAHRWITLARKLTALERRKLDLNEVEEARVTALQASTEALQLRHYDSLTGLPNRELFVSTVGLSLSREHRVGSSPTVLFLDIDDFREVNDLIGRSLGDELLKVVARRLQNSLRADDLVSRAGQEDTFASFARFGGDQFATLIHDAHERGGAATVAERLLRCLSDPITIGDRQFRLTGRIGIADSADLDGGGEEVLVQRAETAMRYCKQQRGRRIALFESFMDELVVHKLSLKTELRTAIDEEQLFLCYQQLVDSRTSLPTGVEGLLRWQHPGRGVVSPGDFLNVAEDSELIVEIDRWVLREGCRQGKLWLDGGLAPLTISLNVSMSFLEEGDFAEQVLAVLEETGLPPARLQLELSERAVLPEAGRIMAHLDSLARAGVHLAIDDFGTGQTALSYLHSLPLDCIKVDRSFVSRVPTDSASAAIVTAVAAMSNHLGLKVVAEGVESEEQRSFLSGHGYDELQGFLFSRPARAPEVEAMIRDSVERERPTPRARAAGASPGERTSRATAPEPGDGAGGDTSDLAPEPESGREPFHPGLLPAEEQLAAEGRDESASYLLKLARQDFLTGLRNRFSFDERLEHAVAHADRFGHKLALILIDLDDFKYVNDTHGHPTGDKLLVEIGSRLDKIVRSVDTVARIGGDEFAIIYSEFRKVDNVAEFARRILSALSEPVRADGQELRVTGSLGVTVYPEGNTLPKDLLRQADLALYKAKSLGGNKIHFFAREMDRDVQRSLALARDLSGALERNEFLVEYQPLVELESSSIVGVEALLRWRHPTDGLIDPDSFIPVAESTGKIRSLGSWVLGSACAQAGRWQGSCGRALPVSVNISPVQCRDPHFAETVLLALRDHGLAPELLHLELSERLLRNLPEDLEHSLRRLEEAGVGLTLDNFGSDSTALEHFQRFRFQRLKIDKSLVGTVGDGTGSGAVLSGIVALAHKLEMQIVAEGIEQPEQAQRLLAEGCHLGQGFLFTRPLAEDRLVALLRKGGGRLPHHSAGDDPAPPRRHPEPEPAVGQTGTEARLRPVESDVVEGGREARGASRG